MDEQGSGVDVTCEPTSNTLLALSKKYPKLMFTRVRNRNVKVVEMTRVSVSDAIPRDANIFQVKCS